MQILGAVSTHAEKEPGESVMTRNDAKKENIRETKDFDLIC